MKRQLTLTEFEKRSKFPKTSSTASSVGRHHSDDNEEEYELYDTDNMISAVVPSSSSTSTDSDSSHLFRPNQSTRIPNDIAHSCDDKPFQPLLKSFQKTRIGDRNRSFAVHWYQSYPFIEYSITQDAVYCFCCRMFPSTSGYVDTIFTTVGFSH